MIENRGARDGSRHLARTQDSPRNPPDHLGVIKVDEILMNSEAALTTEIGLAMLNSHEFATCDLERFSTKREAFVAEMIRRFCRRFPVALIRRVAEAEFDIGLEIIRLRES